MVSSFDTLYFLLKGGFYMEEHTEHKKQETKEESITLKKSTLWVISTIILGGLLILSIFTGGVVSRNYCTPTS